MTDLHIEQTEDPMTVAVNAMASAFREVTATTQGANRCMLRLKRAWITIDAHWQAGDSAGYLQST